MRVMLNIHSFSIAESDNVTFSVYRLVHCYLYQLPLESTDSRQLSSQNVKSHPL